MIERELGHFVAQSAELQRGALQRLLLPWNAFNCGERPSEISARHV